MNNIFNSIELCLSTNNWYAGLALALTLSDTCGGIAYPGEQTVKNNRKLVSNSYTHWFDEYVKPTYTSTHSLDPNSPVTIPKKALLTQYPRGIKFSNEYNYSEELINGLECYGLRCAYLHESNAEINSQLTGLSLNSFEFRYPTGNGISVHRNTFIMDNHLTLQIQVDVFIQDMLNAAKLWWSNFEGDKNAASDTLLMIKPI